MSQTPDIKQNPNLPTAVILVAFRQALQSAVGFCGATSPNPPVGCVLLDMHGNQLAKTAHQKAGAPHAEALAIEYCRENKTLERIHTVVVTLEPCNHAGRTPPCTEAILATLAQDVWIGAADSNTDVCGMGADKLAASGLNVGDLAPNLVPLYA